MSTDGPKLQIDPLTAHERHVLELPERVEGLILTLRAMEETGGCEDDSAALAFAADSLRQAAIELPALRWILRQAVRS